MSILSSTNSGLDGTISPAQFEIPDLPQKKKKKRHRKDEADDEGQVKGKKKKKKKRHTDQASAEEVTGDAPPSHLALSETAPVKKKKKSKKKDRERQTEVVQLPVESGDLPSPTMPAFSPAVSDVPEASGSFVSSENFDPSLLSHPSQQHFMPFPFPAFPYGASPYMPPSMMASPTLFPTPANLSFPEMAFGSNEDVLRALQALDMSKITNVLRTLGEAATAANDPTGSATQVLVTPLGQVPIPSTAILGRQETTSNQRRILDMSLPGTEHHTSPDHAYLLANKWLNTAKLAELVRTEGLVYKKGKFSAIEEQQLAAAIEGFRAMRDFSEDQMQELIYPASGKNRDNAFWSEITTAIPQRPIIAVYHHVRRSYHPLKKLGRWTPEEDRLLKQAVMDLGQQWEKVSLRVGRMSSDCRDRYRNHIVNRELRVTGIWSRDEEEELTRIVTDMTIKQGKDIDNDVFWGRVSDLMGGKRGRQQCRIKWTDALSKTVKNEGTKPRWSQQDAYILVHKVDSLNVRDDTEIDWKTIPDPEWNLWSAHTLQRRWLTMKRSIKGFEDITHQEIMDILRVKKAQMPSPPPYIPRKRKERKVTSAASVVEDSPLDTPAVIAGSSVEPDALAKPAVVPEDDDTSSPSDSD